MKPGSKRSLRRCPRRPKCFQPLDFQSTVETRFSLPDRSLRLSILLPHNLPPRYKLSSPSLSPSPLHPRALSLRATGPSRPQSLHRFFLALTAAAHFAHLLRRHRFIQGFLAFVVLGFMFFTRIHREKSLFPLHFRPEAVYWRTLSSSTSVPPMLSSMPTPHIGIGSSAVSHYNPSHPGQFCIASQPLPCRSIPAFVIFVFGPHYRALLQLHHHRMCERSGRRMLLCFPPSFCHCIFLLTH